MRRLIFISLILGLLLLSGCGEKNKEAVVFKACVSHANTIIPGNITLYRNVNNDPDTWRTYNFTFADGTFPIANPNVNYVRGSIQGQNINYFYPDGTPIIYSKKILSPTGTILGENKVAIKAILKPIPGTNKSWRDGVEFQRQDFELVNAEFVSCKWS